MRKYNFKILLIFSLMFRPAFSFENSKIDLGNFLINKYEVTIKEFREYTARKMLRLKQS